MPRTLDEGKDKSAARRASRVELTVRGSRRYDDEGLLSHGGIRWFTRTGGDGMRSGILGMVLAGSVMLGVAGCATSEEWAEWKAHNAHFASGSHVGFSFRNREGTAPQVRRTDVAMARAEDWWGKAITVSPEQIIQN